MVAVSMAQSSILIIEDDPDNLELVRFLLDSAGYTVFKAVNGSSGLEIIRREKPDMVLLDLTIPEIDGWSLASQLKSDPETNHIRVVALTAHTLPGDRKRAMDSGCDGYITKPLDVPNFAAQIEAYFK